MALDCKHLCLGLGVISLLFLGIPIRVQKEEIVVTLEEQNFKNYITLFNKSYDTNETEYQIRFDKFQESMKAIELLNRGRASNMSASYGVTKYSDMSKDEFLQLYLQPKLHEHIKRRKSHQSHMPKSQHKHKAKRKRAVDGTLPLHIDWRDKKVVTAVRNQKTCGACWAFSTVETVETMYALKTGILQTLSVQEIIDCARNGNMGCSGGDTCSLLEWLTVNKIHIEPDKEYPLLWKTQTCKLQGSGNGVQVADNYTCDSFIGRENDLLAKLANHGPVAVAINAINWQNYLGGVIQFHCDGSPEMLNHAVQIVGYDRRPPIPHYIMRNSWGEDFGDNGYLYIAIGDNLCGLGTEVAAMDIL